MSYLKLKCIKFRPHWRAYSVHPDSLAGFKGPTSNGREGRKVEEKGKEGGGGEKRREGRGRP